MEIIENKEETRKIESWEKNIKFNEIKIFNTSWAKDNHGKRDTTNLAMFIELIDQKGNLFYWLISEPESLKITKNFSEVSSYNRQFDNRAKEFFGGENEN